MILGRDRAGFPLFIHRSSSFSLSPCCHLPAVILCFTALTTIPFPLIKKTDMPHWQHNVSPAFTRPPDRHAERPITGRCRTIIQIIRPITAHGWRLMRAPANLEAATTGRRGGRCGESGGGRLCVLSTGLRCG